MKLLGESHLGSVHLVCEKKNKNKLFAVKFFKSNRKKHLFENLDSILRFYQNIHILEKNPHPNIVNIFEAVEEDGNYYLIMEYLSGVSLSEFKIDLNIDKIIKLMIELCLALKHLYQFDILHKSLKPSNIIILDGKDLKIKTTDYFLNYSGDIDNREDKSYILELLTYLSPEQSGIINRPIDQRSNFYSIGVILYQLLTGQLPFPSNNLEELFHAQLALSPELPSKINSKIPEELDRMILKLLAKEPQERYQTIEELMKDLHRFQNKQDKKFEPAIDAVGRKKELDFLLEKFKDIENNTPAVVLTYGDAGIGKTNLYRTFHKMIKNKSTFLTYKCFIDLINTPYAIFINMIKDFFYHNQDFYKNKNLIDYINKNKEVVLTLFPFFKDNFKSQSSIDEGEDKIKKNEVLKIFLDVFQTINQNQQNLVILIEDIHWADNESLEVIFYMIKYLKNCRIMLLLSIRKEHLDEFLKKENIKTSPHFHILSLSYLNKENNIYLINKLLGQEKKFNKNFYHKIFNTSFGNPLFIIEIIQNLYNQKILYKKNEIWFVDNDKFENFKMNMDFNSFILNRLQRFSSEEQKILCYMTVLGRNFDFHQLKELISVISQKNNKIYDDSYLLLMIEKALFENLLLERVKDSAKVYSFNHDKIYEILYKRISLHERKELHQIFAELQESKINESANELLYITAYHYNKTDLLEKKIYFNKKAYEVSLNQYSLTTSGFFLKNLIDLSIQNNNEELIDFIISYSFILQKTGKMHEMHEYLVKALEIAKNLNLKIKEVEINICFGSYYYLQNLLSKAVDFFKEALFLADQVNITIENGLVYYYLGISYFFNSDYKLAFINLNKALNYTSENDLDLLLNIYGFRSWTWIVFGNFEKCKEDIKIIEKKIKNINNPFTLSSLYHFLSIYYSYSMENPKKALKYALISYKTAKKHHFIVNQYSSLSSKIYAFIVLNQFDKAIATAKKTIRLAVKNKITVGIHHTMFREIEAYLFKYDFNSAYLLILKMKEDILNIKDKIVIIFIFLSQAIVLYYLDDQESALSSLDEAFALYEETDAHIFGISILYLKYFLLEKKGFYNEGSIYLKKVDQIIKEKKVLELHLLKTKRILTVIEKMKENQIKKIQNNVMDQEIKIKMQYKLLLNINKEIYSFNDLDKLLSYFDTSVKMLTGAERCVVFLLNEEGNFELKFHDKMSFDEHQIQILTERICKNKNGFILTEGKNKIKSGLCMPFKINESVIGWFYLDSNLITNLFTDKDLEIIEIFSRQTAYVLDSIIKRNPALNNEKIKLSKEFCDKYKISKREEEIIILKLKGHKNITISQKLFISEKTVKNHISNIYKKLNITNTIEIFNLIKMNDNHP